MKSTGITYLLWLFSIHRFYLNRPGSGILYLLTCGGFGFWILIDLFLIPGMVQEENQLFMKMMRGGDQTINVSVDNSKGRKRKRRRDDDDD